MKRERPPLCNPNFIFFLCVLRLDEPAKRWSPLPNTSLFFEEPREPCQNKMTFTQSRQHMQMHSMGFCIWDKTGADEKYLLALSLSEEREID